MKNRKISTSICAHPSLAKGVVSCCFLPPSADDQRVWLLLSFTRPRPFISLRCSHDVRTGRQITRVSQWQADYRNRGWRIVAWRNRSSTGGRLAAVMLTSDRRQPAATRWTAFLTRPLSKPPVWTPGDGAEKGPLAFLKAIRGWGENGWRGRTEDEEGDGDEMRANGQRKWAEETEGSRSQIETGGSTQGLKRNFENSRNLKEKRGLEEWMEAAVCPIRLFFSLHEEKRL